MLLDDVRVLRLNGEDLQAVAAAVLDRGRGAKIVDLRPRVHGSPRGEAGDCRRRNGFVAGAAAHLMG